MLHFSFILVQCSNSICFDLAYQCDDEWCTASKKKKKEQGTTMIFFSDTSEINVKRGQIVRTGRDGSAILERSSDELKMVPRVRSARAVEGNSDRQTRGSVWIWSTEKKLTTKRKEKWKETTKEARTRKRKTRSEWSVEQVAPRTRTHLIVDDRANRVSFRRRVLLLANFKDTMNF